jgi:hypothetical protein
VNNIICETTKGKTESQEKTMKLDTNRELFERLDAIECSSNLLQGYRLSQIWRQEQLIRINTENKPRSWDKLIDVVLAHVLPPDVVPMSLARHPFIELDRDTCATVVARALTEPDRMGQLTDSIRRVLGFQRILPKKYVITEAHIDATSVDVSLVRKLVSLGFETDNFARIEPAQYKHHFTLKLVMERSATHDLTSRYRGVLNASKLASQLIDDFSKGYGYVETEWYDNDLKRSFDFRPLATGSLDNFPFNASTFLKQAVPSTEEEAKEQGASLQKKRAADIHVKIPGYFYLSGCPDHSINDRQVQALKSRLIECGFYEILSESGNFIYSAHFANIHEARAAFAQLTNFAAQYGTITEVCCEVCTRIWRKRVVSGSDWFLAEVPPHLSFRQPAISHTNHYK